MAVATCFSTQFHARSLQCANSAGEAVLVMVQSQTQEDMDVIMAQMDAQAQGSGPARVALGVIAATMRRILRARTL